MTRPEHWNDDTKAAWLTAHEPDDPYAAPGPATHVVTYRPEVRINVVLPAWVDARQWLRDASNHWDNWLSDGLEIAFDPPGHALVNGDVTARSATVEAVALDPDTLDGPTIPTPDTPPFDFDAGGW